MSGSERDLPEGFPVGELPLVTDPDQRARERGADQLFGDNFGAADEERGYLGDPEAVDALVRGFLGVVVEQRKRWNEGAADGAAAAEAVGREARVLANLFNGQEDSRYRKVRGWNAPENLGAHLKERFNWSCPDAEAAEVLFVELARRVVGAMEAHERDAMTDEQAQFEVEAAVEDTRLALLGLPQERTQ